MIGGNNTITIQSCVATTNDIGEVVRTWNTMHVIRGWLDLQTGDTNRQPYNAKIEQASHVFVCDYVDISDVNAEEARALIGGERYDVTYIDDPMEMHKHLEIFLRSTGAQGNE